MEQPSRQIRLQCGAAAPRNSIHSRVHRTAHPHPPSPAPHCTPAPHRIAPTQIVYEFLLRYVVSSDTDAKLAKRHIDQNFVVHLLDLFDSGGWVRVGV